MKVYCCYTEAHKPLLKDHFIPSLPNDVQLVAIPLDIKGKGDFLSSEFIKCINQKIGLIEESLKVAPGSIIVWADIDIIFFQSFKSVIEQLMNTGGYDLLFQKEGFGQWEEEVNAGFIAMRCNDNVTRFYNQVRQRLQAHPEKNEQPIINELLQEIPDIRYSMLPVTFAAKSHGWPPRDDLILYHANVTMGKNGVQQKIDQFLEVEAIRKLKSRKICVVSPEVIGPRRNSGIGTHTSHLLKSLTAHRDTDVTLLMTSEIHVEKEGGWAKWFEENMQVRFVHLEPEPHPYPWIGWFNHWYNYRSLQVYNFLHQQNFQIIHFQDLNADGFICHQARETGVAFEKTVFTTMINGPAKWAREGMKTFVADEVYEGMLNFMEGYCFSKSDIVIYPSRYALEYVSGQAGWDLADEKRLCPYMLDLPALEDVQAVGEPAIIFFGRLETRKGIHLFLAALERLDKFGDGNIPRNVIFLGAHSDTPAGPSRDVIPRFFSEKLPEWKFTIHDSMDQPACIEFLNTKRHSVVVLPSISETLGYVAIECLSMGLNVIGANSGAFPEVFAGTDRLFESHPRAIAKKIGEAFAGNLSPPESLYSRDAANDSWQKLHQRCVEVYRAKQEKLCRSIESPPLVSVCLTYFNYEKYIDEQIQSLEKQTYGNFEVVVINDGSTEQKSIDKFNELRERLGNDTRFRFYDQENIGLCLARNKAVSLARGELIVFCDADNISKPCMLETFVTSIKESGADCVTCYFEKFRVSDDGIRQQLDYYTPVGSCTEVGPFVDPYGDANCIIRKSVFTELGGFRHEPFTASEDWEFFSELTLSGYKLEVVPAVLFEYREHDLSNMRTTSFYDTRMRTIYPYLKRTSGWMKNFIINAMGAWEVKKFQQRQTDEKMASLNRELETTREEFRAAAASQEKKCRQLEDQLQKEVQSRKLAEVKVNNLEDLLDSMKSSLIKRLFFRK